MKILQLCIRVPFPPVDGGSIAMYNLAASLKNNGASVKILAFNTIKQGNQDINSSFKKEYGVETVFLDNNIKIIPAFLNLFSDKSYHVTRFISKDFSDLLQRILNQEEFDVIQMESIFMMPYYDIIRKNSKAVIALRAHNIEYLIWERIAAESSNPLKKIYVNLLAERLKKFELDAFRKADIILTLSREDEKIIMLDKTVSSTCIIPIGLDIKDYPVQTNHAKAVLFHIGAMDWIPNQEGMKWFIKNVWPPLKKEFPDLKFRMAGKNMPAEFFKYQDKNFEVFSFVENAQDFMTEGSIMIVPLFSGSGIRVKIIEGMALGKAVITTSIGLEGIPAENGKEVMLADTPEEFTRSVIHLLKQEKNVEEMGKNARLYAEKHFDNQQIGLRLLKVYSDFIIHKKKSQ